ncbi:hypothetical protein FBU30_005406 [Linnemannia zychae]|nr:hypothetical protein FBU30_005406 [Linnemannia zychae]
MKVMQLTAITLGLVATSSNIAMAVLSVAVKSCTKTIVVQDESTTCAEFAKANACTLDDLFAWNSELDSACSHKSHLEKGIALCVSVSANTTTAAMAVSLSNESILSSGSTRDIISSSRESSDMVMSSTQSSNSDSVKLVSLTSPSTEATKTASPLPAAPKSEAVIVHDSGVSTLFVPSMSFISLIATIGIAVALTTCMTQ